MKSLKRLARFASALALVSCGDSSGGGSDGNSSATDGTETGTGTTGIVDTCTSTPEAARDCIEQPRYVSDLEFIADIRTPGSTHWQAVQDLCADRLTELGFEVDLSEYATGINVVGRKLGTERPDEIVLVGAHYDHIEDCVGADDNATGVAGILELARVLAQGDFARTLMVACWDEEEVGLEGSKAFVAWAAGNGINIPIYYNYDMIGYASDEPDSQAFPPGIDVLFPTQLAEVEANQFRADFLAIIGDDLAHEHVLTVGAHADAIGLPNLAGELASDLKNNDLVADLRRSDHAPFWAVDIPAIFMTDTGEFRNNAYHCFAGTEDTVDRLDHEFAAQVLRATVGSMVQALRP